MPPKQHKLWRLVQIVVLVGLLGVGAWVILNRQNVIDWWRLRNYTPSAQVQQIADATTMAGRGRDMFYVSDPKVEDRDTFNQHCRDKTEEGSVLGCYFAQQIYIYHITDARLPNVVEVTAAHEMLHAGYDRLDDATKTRVNKLLEAEEVRLKDDAELQKIIALYARTEPGEKLNELHSILGTEYGGLSAELETYYKQYFTDRAKVVAMAQGYKSVFSESKARIAGYSAQLATLKQQIDSNTADLERRIAEINAESDQLDNLRQSNPSAYNQRVPGFNAKVREYNSLARTTQDLVNQYNAIVVQINNEAAKQTDLNNSLDSKYQPVPAQ